jgi:hypothetical protein
MGANSGSYRNVMHFVGIVERRTQVLLVRRICVDFFFFLWPGVTPNILILLT